jgi:hypothetical protein
MNNLFNFGKSNNKKINNNSKSNNSNNPNNSNKSNFGLGSLFGNNKSNNTRSNNSTNVKVNNNVAKLNNLNNNKKNGGFDFNFEIENIIQYILIIILAIIIIYVFTFSVKYMISNKHPKKPYFTYLFGMRLNDVYIEEKSKMDKLNEIRQKIQANISFDDEGSIKATPSNSSPLNLFDRKIVKNNKEVFYISDNIFSYNDSKCLCSNMNAKLATKEDLINAYNNGFTNNSYGWVDKQQAFFVKQPCDVKNDKTRRAGLNGGFFSNPELKFGVFCYGNKPDGQLVKEKEPICDKEICDTKKFNAERLKNLNISPFNKDSWSQFNNN